MSSEPRRYDEDAEPSLGVVAHRKDDLRVELVVRPRPAADEAVVRVAYGGICGSDLHYWRHGAAGESILREPLLLGHEVAGWVVAPAADGRGPAAGTQVTVHPASPGAGDGGRYPVASPNLSPGGTYLGSAARYPHTQGGFARQVNIPARMLRALPAGVPLRLATLAEPASVAWHAVARGGDIAGKAVLVVGAGPIGLLITAVARRAGAAQITVVDVHEKPLATARALGATRTVAAHDVEAISRVDADVSFEASGTVAGVESGIRATTRGGRVVLVGLLPPGGQPVPASLAISRELILIGSYRFNNEMDLVIAALADGSLDIEPVISHEFPVEQALSAFAVAANSAESGKVLLSF